MKKICIALFSLVLIVLIASCGNTKETVDIPDITAAEKEAFSQTEGDTIKISSDESEYEIIIIEPGFNIWMNSIARMRGYYSQGFLETRNQIMVANWNQRVMQPNRFNPNLYQLPINYESTIDYGYEVNYKLYNYFIYFQRKYRQRLGPFVVRI